MNILPKKSWHVRNKDNVARVRRDEENARLEEEKKAQRAALAEQEARTALLRSQAKARGTDQSSESSTEKALLPQGKPQHINFFADIEEGLKQGSNPEYEAEKKAEQEKAEKAIGLLTYLGQSAAERQGNTPWYLSTSGKQEVPESNKELKKKELLDPLRSMKKHLKTKSVTEQKHKRDSGSHRKHKKHKREKEGKESKRTSRQKRSVEELRAERLKREKEEREKARQLLAAVRGEAPPGGTSPDTETPHRYNSQFHPELARKPRGDSRRYQPY